MRLTHQGATKVARLSLAFILLGIITGMTASCAAMRAGAAYQDSIQQQVDGYVYRTDMDTVWEETKSMFFDMGFAYDEGRTGDLVLTTDWRVTPVTDSTSGNESGQKRVRYMVRGTRLENGGTVEIREQMEQRNRQVVDRTMGGAVYGEYAEGWSQASIGRSFDMEHMLIKRVEPQRAARIEQKANAAAEAARNEDG